MKKNLTAYENSIIISECVMRLNQLCSDENDDIISVLEKSQSESESNNRASHQSEKNDSKSAHSTSSIIGGTGDTTAKNESLMAHLTKAYPEHTASICLRLLVSRKQSPKSKVKNPKLKILCQLDDKLNDPQLLSDLKIYAAIHFSEDNEASVNSKVSHAHYMLINPTDDTQSSDLKTAHSAEFDLSSSTSKAAKNASSKYIFIRISNKLPNNGSSQSNLAEYYVQKLDAFLDREDPILLRFKIKNLVEPSVSVKKEPPVISSTPLKTKTATTHQSPKLKSFNRNKASKTTNITLKMFELYENVNEYGLVLSGESPARIAQIQPGSQAEKIKKLQPGDEIIEVNFCSVKFATARTVENLIR